MTDTKSFEDVYRIQTARIEELENENKVLTVALAAARGECARIQEQVFTYARELQDKEDLRLTNIAHLQGQRDAALSEVERLKAEQGYDRQAALQAALVDSRERMESAVKCLQEIQNNHLTIKRIWGLAMEAEYSLTLDLPALPPRAPDPAQGEEK